MFQTIDENIENQKAKELADKITPEMLGLKSTNDFAQYSNERIINEVPEYIPEWTNKGPIDVMEAGKMFANEFDGTYGNVYTNTQQRQDFLNKHQKIKEYSNSVDERIARNKQNKLERNQRVNEGTGSFFDRAGAFLDRLGNSQYNAQVEYAKKQDELARPKKDDPNYKYVPLGLDRAGNVVYDEIDLREKIGFVEALRESVSSGKATPFVGGAIEAKANNRIDTIQEKIRNGEQITQEELEHFNRYKNHEYEKQIRGYSIGGSIGDSVLPSIFAFGSELAFGGAVLKGIGLAGKGVQAGQKLTQGLLKANKLGKAGEAAAKGAGYAAGQLAEGALGAGATLAVNIPTRVWATYSERRLNDKVKITDHGTVIFTEAKETPAKAFMKSMGSTFVSYFSEHMGGLIGATVFKPLGMIAQKAVNNSATKGLMGAGAKQFEKIVSANPQLTKFVNDTVPLLSKAYEKLNGLPIKGKSVDWLKSKVKFDGFMEELGEEVLEDVLNITIGTNYEERSLDNYVKAIVKTPEEWAVLAGTIALQGGTLSLAGNLLGDAMQRSGVDEEKIVEVLANSTENEKQELVSELIDNNTIQLNEITNEERENKEALKAHIEKNVYEKLVGANVSQEEADNVAITVLSMFNKYGNNEESRNIIDKIFDKLITRYNVPVGKRAQEDNTQYQSASLAGADESEAEVAKKEWEEKETKSKYFKKWFGDSKAVDEDNDPKILFRGDTVTFDTFDKEKASAEGDMGAGFYFSDNESDVDSNYYDGGPDFDNKVSRLAEQIQNEKEEEGEDIDYEEAKELAEKQLRGTPQKLEVYLSIQKPVYVGTNETYLLSDIDEYFDINEEDYEDEDEYYQAQAEARDEALGNIGYDIDSELGDLLSYEDIEKAKGILFEYVYDGGVTLQTLKDRLNEEYFEDYEGNFVSNEVARRIVKALGYDGIIDDTVSEKFRNMGMEYGTTHYIVFEPEQIKSVNNQGTFDSENPNIYFQPELAKSFKILKDIFSKKDKEKVSDLFDKIPMLDRVRDYFSEVIDDIYFQEMPDWMVKDSEEIGNFLNFNKTIYINTNKITSYSNSPQVFIRTILHELMHAKLNKAIDYAIKHKNKDNTKFLNTINLSKENIKKYKEFNKKYKSKDLKNNKALAQLRREMYDLYNNSAIEREVDNVALALQSYMGQSTNESIKGYSLYLRDITDTKAKRGIDGNIQEYIRRFNERVDRNHFGYGRLSDNVNTYNVWYQEANENNKDGVDEFGNPLVAGFTIAEVNDKLTSLWEEAYALDEIKDKKLVDEIITKANILSEIINPNIKHSEEDYLNVYQIMTEDEISHDYVEENKKSQRYISEYKDLVRRKKEKREKDYLGYFEKRNKTEYVITLMKSKNASTALHEFGHLFLEALNDLASVDEKAREDLKAINKFLGANGEYTKEQHEKFAASFEAYMWTGKAPTNKLKEVFKRFKEWLRAVYENITDIPNAEISPEVQKLFDGIFGGEEYYENKKQSKELLEKIKKSTSPKKKEKYTPDEVQTLSDEAKRHKEAAYEIVSVATGKNIKYLKSIFETENVTNAIFKKRENVMREVENSEDKIAASGGMQENWIEFFGKANVDYENNDVGASEDLAHKALDVIINKSYVNNDKLQDYENERALAMQKYIDDVDHQYNVLLLEFKRGNEQKRNVAYGTFNEWIDGINSDMHDDYYERFLNDIAIIERRENQDKFAKAKENIINAAINIRNKYSINNNEAYKELVLKIMNNLDFLQPSDKAKMTTQILDISNFYDLEYKLNNILDIAETMEDVRLRQNMMSEIHKELQGTKNVKKGARTVGKYDYKTNKLFEELRRIDKLTTEQANEERLNRDYTKAEDEGLSFQDKIINKFLSYKANGSIYADSEQIKSLYDDILRIKLAGKNAKDEAELFEKFSDEQEIKELIDVLRNTKANPKFGNEITKWMGNLYSSMNYIFNKKIAEKYSMEYLNTKTSTWIESEKKKFKNAIQEIYGRNNFNWRDDLINNTNITKQHYYFKRTFDVTGENVIKVEEVPIKLNKMNYILAHIWCKNDILKARLENMFGKEQLEDMLSSLSTQDEKLGDFMVQMTSGYYPYVNRIYIEKYGLDLPKVNAYFPSKVETNKVSEFDLLNDFTAQSLGRSFTKNRTESTNVIMDFSDPVQMLMTHISNVGKFINEGVEIDRINKIFLDSRIKREVENKFDKDTYKILVENLADITYKKQAQEYSKVDSIFSKIANNFIGAAVMVKPTITIKQLLSMTNYSVDMPYNEWFEGLAQALSHPKKTIDFMMKIPYIRARFESGGQNEALKDFMKADYTNNKLAKFNARMATIKEYLSLNIRLGDIGAIIFGGKPYYDYLIKQGLTKEEAEKKFIENTVRSQQSSEVSTLSAFQRGSNKNGFNRLFTAFRNASIQYVRAIDDTIVQHQRGEIDTKQAAKSIFNFLILQPYLYEAVGSGTFLTWLLGNCDLIDVLKELLHSSTTGLLGAFGLLGDLAKSILNKVLFGEKIYTSGIPVISDLEKDIQKLYKQDLKFQDVVEALSDIAKINSGIPFDSILSMASGVGDVANGKPAKGILKAIGYTDKRAKRIVGEKDEKKKKTIK